MARLREFSEDEVLDAAIGIFSQRGFEATSMQDIVAATGLTVGSIYKAFGDKKGLFHIALTRYMDQTYRQYHLILTTPESPRQGLLDWLQNSFKPDSGSTDIVGCFAVNSIVEMGPFDSEARTILSNHQNRVLAMLIDQIQDGQRRDELRCDLSANDIAAILGIYHMGANAASRSVLTTQEASRLAHHLIKLVAPVSS